MPDELQRHQAALARLDRYATLMDARFRVPGTRIRFGLDPVIGLLPGIGDALGLALSLYVVVEAIRLGVSKRVLFRMLGNVGLEALVGVVPVLGDVFDIGFKANLRNAALLRSSIEDRLRPTPVRASRRWQQWVLLVAFASLILALLLALRRLFAPLWQGSPAKPAEVPNGADNFNAAAVYGNWRQHFFAEVSHFCFRFGSAA